MTEVKTLNSVNKALKLKFKDKKLVFGQGSVGAKIVLVSEMLDQTGEADNKPVSGANAKLINQLLKSAGIDKKKVYTTNVVKYRPETGKMPTPKEIKSHATFLKEEIRTVNPEVVVTLGNLLPTLSALENVEVPMQGLGSSGRGRRRPRRAGSRRHGWRRGW